MTRILAVTGVTGTQGSAVARELLRRGWRVRGLSRRPHGKAARRLASAGVEIIAGDMDDKGALGTLLRGANAAYCVTDFSLSMPTWLFARLVHPALAEMWQWLAEHRWGAPVEATRKLHPEVRSLKTWLRARRSSLEI